MARFPYSLTLVLLLCTACGGGGGSGDSDAAVEITMQSTAALDGTVSRGFINSVNTTGSIVAGDEIRSLSEVYQYFGFVSFDLSALPSGAVVEQATVVLHQRDTLLGSTEIVAEHVDYGDSLELSDSDLTALSQSTVFVTDTSSAGPRVLDVTAFVQDDARAGRARSQLRLLSPDRIRSVNYAFNSGDDSVGDGSVPTLTIEYRLP